MNEMIKRFEIVGDRLALGVQLLTEALQDLLDIREALKGEVDVHTSELQGRSEDNGCDAGGPG
ncbi:unnamed protein product [marine sediment metagenome]|uniref:Uncharacterized protein n=1 Tax=marine sediment metagenome TaxID=412755 RepID=X0UN75_9ZZZZ